MSLLSGGSDDTTLLEYRDMGASKCGLIGVAAESVAGCADVARESLDHQLAAASINDVRLESKRPCNVRVLSCTGFAYIRLPGEDAGEHSVACAGACELVRCTMFNCMRNALSITITITSNRPVCIYPSPFGLHGFVLL